MRRGRDEAPRRPRSEARPNTGVRPPPRRPVRGPGLADGAERPARGPARPAPRPPAAEAVKIPHDPLNERVILAAAIVHPETRRRLVRTLPADGFYGRGHAAAWAALVEIDRRGLQYDPATVRQLSGGTVDTDYLDELVAERPRLPPNLPHHVECFLWDRVRIEAAKGPVQALLEAMRDPNVEPDRLRALGRAVSSSLDRSGPLRYLRDPDAVKAEAKRRIRDRRARFRSGFLCHPYGVDGLDLYPDGSPRLIPGMEPGQMTLVVGLSGSGKTTVTNQIVLAQTNAGRRVLHGAWEQDGETNLESLAAFSVRLARTRLRIGDIDDDEEAAIDAEIDRLGDLVRFFELPFGRDPGQKLVNDRNLDLIHQHVAESGCEIAVFDLWKRALRQSEPSEEEWALWRQQAIAKETKTHHILLHHLRGKDVEARADKRPTREGTKGSGAWIDVFDTIFGVHNPALWKAVPNDTLQVLVLKQRYGKWPLAVEFDHDERTGIISNGRPIEYEQPGESRGMDSFLDQPAESDGGRRGGRGRGRTR